MQLPDKFAFSHGGFFGEYDEVKQYRRNQLSCRYAISPGDHEPPVFAQPTSAEWEEFWIKLDSIGVWRWRSEYLPANPVMDGTQWSLQLAFAGKQLVASGDNDYPGGCDYTFSESSEFGQFIQALLDLTGFKKLLE